MLRIGTLLGLLGTLLATAALAQYPAKAIRVVAPFPPGGALDVVGRILAGPLSQTLGQPVVVENRPGADGAIAADLVAKSAPDGHTLFLASYTNLSALPNIRKNLPFDPLGDFIPLSSVGKLSFFLTIHPDLPARTAREFIDYARANPGKLNYGSANATSMLGPALLASFAKLEMHPINYKGEALALNDFMSGRLQLMFISGTLVPHVKDGKLRALATTPRPQGARCCQRCRRWSKRGFHPSRSTPGSRSSSRRKRRRTSSSACLARPRPLSTGRRPKR